MHLNPLYARLPTGEPARLPAAALTVALLAGVLAFSTATPARAGLECAAGLDRATLLLARATGNAIDRCLDDAAAGRRPTRERLETCVAADRGERQARAADRVRLIDVARCGERPPTGAEGANVRDSVVVAELLGLAADVLGGTPAVAARTIAGGGAGARCRRIAVRSTDRLVHARLRAHARCKLGALADPDDCMGVDSTKVEHAFARLATRVSAHCDGLPQAELLPGTCASDPLLASCLATRAGCRACRIAAVSDALDADCDRVDDGVENGSCAPVVVVGPPAPGCGNGVLEEDEACDSFDACCTPDCTAVDAGAPCASDGDACTLDVCNGAGRCVHASTCAWTFTDATVEAGIDHAHEWDPSAYVNPALERARIAGGVAAGDVDGDGWVDLYVVGGPDGVNRLLINQGDGTFEDQAAAAGLARTGKFDAGPVFADIDGNGALDLLLGGVNGAGLQVFRNRGDGSFEDVSTASGINVAFDTYGAAFGDYDLDGDLDLYLASWARLLESKGRLWRNDGDGSFTDVTSGTGVGAVGAAGGLEWSCTPNFADIDGDGWPDLLVAADFGSSQVFRNRGDSTFVETTTAAITDENGMGASVVDYDGDGDLDWFVTSIFDPNGTPEGNWGVTGNRLYRNRGDGTFDDVTEEAGVRDGGWGWGSCAADFNLDGHPDLLHVNGYSSDSAAEYYFDPVKLFVSRGDGTFAERAAELGLTDTGQGRGVVCFDYDRDGDVDVFVDNNGQAPVLWKNGAEMLGNHFLHVSVRGAPPNTEAIGARVTVSTYGRTQMREIRAGSNYASQDPAVAHFGLGDAAVVDELRVVWPDGAERSLFSVAADQFLVIERESTSAAVRFVDVTNQAGLDYLQRREPTDAFLPPEAAEQATGGVAAGDYDGDGWPDLLFTRVDDAPILYRNEHDGTFTDVTVTAGDLATALPRGSNGAAWADVDNDGDQDLYLTSYGTLRFHLFLNQGDGTFVEDAVARGAAVASRYMHYGMGVAFGDYDLDGWLDLFAAEWWAHPAPPAPPLPGRSHNRLLRNVGADAPGTFVDVTGAAEIDVETLAGVATSVLGTPGFSPGFVDFDDDGHPDIAWVADWGNSRLLWNDGDGTFSDGTVVANVGLERSGMGSAQADFDGDGLMDWFVTSIYGRADELRFGVSNQLYINRGDRTFDNVTVDAGVADGGFGWAASAFDFDNDGDVDIAHTNGMLQPGHPASVAWQNDRTRLFANDGAGRFVEVGGALGIVDVEQGKCLVTLDYDRDGDLDVVVANHGGAPVLYRNDGGNGNAWLRLRLVGTSSNRDGIGAVVTVDVDGDGPAPPQKRQALRNSNFLGHDEPVLHFGLGPGVTTVDRVTIRWPSGTVQTLEGATARQELTVVEP